MWGDNYHLDAFGNELAIPGLEEDRGFVAASLQKDGELLRWEPEPRISLTPPSPGTY